MNLTNFFTISYAFLILYSTEFENKEALAYLKSYDAKELSNDNRVIQKAIQAALSKNKGIFDSALVNLGNDLKKSLPAIARSGNITSRKLDILKTIAVWMRTGSEVAYRKLGTISATHPLPWIPAFFAKDVGSQEGTRTKIRNLLKKHFGFKNPVEVLDVDQAAALKEKDPEAYKEYLKLRREFNLTWKEAVSTYVRMSKKGTVPMKEIEKFLKESNLEHNWPTGFTGNVGADGAWYTKQGKRIDGIPAATLFPKVKMMNEDGNGAVFVAVRENGELGGYFYTMEYRKVARDDKFKAVSQLIDKIAGMRKRWSQTILQFDPDSPKCIGSLILEMSYQFASRIGSPGNTATQGLSTIRMKNVKPTPQGGYRIRYLGKDSVPTLHEIRPPTVGTNVDKAMAKAFASLLLEDKEPNDFVFSIRKPRGWALVNPKYVNDLFRSYGAPSGATVHKLRTLRGTRFMMEALKDLYERKQRFNDAKTFEAELTKLAKAVGKQLNHVRRTKEGSSEVTGTTALINYIDPSIIVGAYEHYRFPLPRWLEKITTASFKLQPETV
jgi:hypothetical protein